MEKSAIKYTKSYELLDCYLRSENKITYLNELSRKYSSKTTNDLSRKICEVINLHHYSPVFTLRPTNTNCSMYLKDNESYSVQLGPQEPLPLGLTYIDWGNMIGFKALPQEIFQSSDYVQEPISGNTYLACFQMKI